MKPRRGLQEQRAGVAAQGNPERAQVHDFPDPTVGKAIPYGVYDVAANTGWVSVGRDHDTSAFAVSTLRRWWASVGHIAYPTADRLLICADSGGSNGYRVLAWKTELAALARETVDSPRDRPDHHGLPPATRHPAPGTRHPAPGTRQMEPDRAPLVQPRGGRRPHRRDRPCTERTTIATAQPRW